MYEEEIYELEKIGLSRNFDQSFIDLLVDLYRQKGLFYGFNLCKESLNISCNITLSYAFFFQFSNFIGFNIVSRDIEQYIEQIIAICNSMDTADSRMGAIITCLSKFLLYYIMNHDIDYYFAVSGRLNNEILPILLSRDSQVIEDIKETFLFSPVAIRYYIDIFPTMLKQMTTSFAQNPSADFISFIQTYFKSIDESYLKEFSVLNGYEVEIKDYFDQLSVIIQDYIRLIAVEEINRPNEDSALMIIKFLGSVKKKINEYELFLGCIENLILFKYKTCSIPLILIITFLFDQNIFSEKCFDFSIQLGYEYSHNDSLEDLETVLLCMYKACYNFPELASDKALESIKYFLDAQVSNAFDVEEENQSLFERIMELQVSMIGETPIKHFFSIETLEFDVNLTACQFHWYFEFVCHLFLFAKEGLSDNYKEEIGKSAMKIIEIAYKRGFLFESSILALLSIKTCNVFEDVFENEIVTPILLEFIPDIVVHWASEDDIMDCVLDAYLHYGIPLTLLLSSTNNVPPYSYKILKKISKYSHYPIIREYIVYLSENSHDYPLLIALINGVIDSPYFDLEVFPIVELLISNNCFCEAISICFKSLNNALYVLSYSNRVTKDDYEFFIPKALKTALKLHNHQFTNELFQFIISIDPQLSITSNSLLLAARVIDQLRVFGEPIENQSLDFLYILAIEDFSKGFSEDIHMLIVDSLTYSYKTSNINTFLEDRFWYSFFNIVFCHPHKSDTKLLYSFLTCENNRCIILLSEFLSESPHIELIISELSKSLDLDLKCPASQDSIFYNKFMRIYKLYSYSKNSLIF